MTDRTIRIQRVLIGLFAANLVVVVAKLIIGLALDSLAVLGDSAHASVDAMNNVLALIVIRVAARGPDENHPYGHTKFETLGALAIVVFLSISGFELVRGAILRLLAGPEVLNATGVQIAALAGTLVINTLVATYEARKGHELKSQLLLADAAHTKADVFITSGVLIAVVLSRLGFPWADPFVALIVAGAIAVIAYRIVARSVPILVDEHVVAADVIERAVADIDGIVQAYGIRSRGSPDRRFAEVTIAVDRHATVDAAHKLADKVEMRLRSDLGFHEIIVHIEPC